MRLRTRDRVGRWFITRSRMPGIWRTRLAFLCRDGNRDDLIRGGRRVADRYTASNVTTKWETLLERLCTSTPGRRACPQTFVLSGERGGPFQGLYVGAGPR